LFAHAKLYFCSINLSYDYDNNVCVCGGVLGRGAGAEWLH